MSNAIDQAQLKASAEDLERAFLQHAHEPVAQQLLFALCELIGEAKARRVRAPLEFVPCALAFADGVFSDLKNPDVDELYVAFALQLRGRLSLDDQEDFDRLSAARA